MFGKFKIKDELDTGTCHVCGDTGANFHYNGFSCQSCRVFFTRALLRGKPFICLYKEKCFINKETRTNCPACRFQKCKDANMDTRDVGRYKRQGSAVVQYYSKHQLVQHTKKFAQSVALGFQFVKELDSSFPATKFAEILVSLDRMCSAGPDMCAIDLKVNVDTSLTEALLSSTSCAPRSSIQFDETTTVENITNLVVSHYCRGMTFLSDFMNAAPEIHRLSINDRIKLARYSLVDTVLLTMVFRQWQKNVRSGLTFFHGVHYEPPEVDSGNSQVVNQYCREVGNLMENHVAQIFDETAISEEEFTLLRMVVLFQPPQDISDAGRDVIRHASARYSRILATLYDEKYTKLTPEQRLARLQKILGVVFHTKVILESNTLIAKGSEYNILIPWLGTGLLIATGDKWRTRRKMLTPSFHYGILNKFMPVFNKQSKIFLDQIESYATADKEFDLFPYIKRCTLDIICETAMGCTISAQTNHDHPYVNSVQCMNEIVFKYQRMPWLRIAPIWWLTGIGYEYEKHLRVLTVFTKSVISERLETSQNCVETGKKAFLDTLIELYKHGNLSDEDIREEVDTFMFEGHDTTSAGIGWALWCLACHQDCQQKVLEEIDTIFTNDRNIEHEDLPKLTYLDRCVKEALRMRPPVPGFTRTVDEDIEVDGTLIPQGCSIVISPHIMHMHHELYENFVQYNPDRFLEEEVAKRHPYAYIPFSAGQKFALVEEKTVLTWFFRRYRINCNMPFLDNIPRPEVINRPSKGFPVTIQRRF